MLDKAITLAKIHNSGGKQKIVAIITDKKGKILSIGANSYVKTHPYQKQLAEQVELDEHIYLHAEISALIKLKSLKPTSIYIARTGPTGEPLLAKPCAICQHALMLAGISSIYHT